MKTKKEDIDGCFELFSKWLKEEGDYIRGGGIYSDATVMWLMAFQRLNEGASLARALEEFSREPFWELCGDCKRVRERRVSPNTGGYAQARAGLGVDIVERVSDELFEWLSRQSVHKTGERELYALDGSSLELLRSKELLKDFPSHKQRGHYPLMRILVCHNLTTGLAVRPEYGAMYGQNRKGEIELCKSMFKRLPKDAVIVADRNFGIFAATYCAQEAGLDVVFRLQENRAKKVLGTQPKHGIDQEVEWTPSAQDLKGNAEIPQDALVKGRVICREVRSHPNKKATLVYLFTTLGDPAKEIIQMYGMRWNIEIDLRTLKQTVNMKMLKVKTADMAKKELFLGICAYNLVRAVISNVAKRLGVKPRDLSFKRILYIVEARSEALSKAPNEQKRQQIMERFWQSVPCAKHPKRKKKRDEPRALVRNRRQKYPSLKGSRKKARAEIMKKN